MHLAPNGTNLNRKKMDEQLSKSIALRLIDALSVEDVQKVLNDEAATYYFADPQNWLRIELQTRHQFHSKPTT